MNDFLYAKIGRMKLYFVLLMKSHLQSYPCPLQINSFWNLGFLLGMTIIIQIITGIFLGLHYTSDLNSAYSSIFFFIREIFYGWCLRYLHSSGASFVFLFLFLHLGRAISYVSYFYNTNTWFSGIILFFFLMATAFMGYVLPFGQMSFWGATVITNLLSPFPSFIEWVSGGHYVYNPTLKRFFLFHFIFPFLLCGFRILHLFYLHFLSSNNPLRNSTNNKIPFFPFLGFDSSSGKTHEKTSLIQTRRLQFDVKRNAWANTSSALNEERRKGAEVNSLLTCLMDLYLVSSSRRF